jgi:hypothetical protein
VNGLDFPLGPASAEWTVTGAPNSYWVWMYPRLTTTAGALPAQDLDADGIANVLEFAFGLSPEESDTAGLPVPSRPTSALALDYLRRSAGSLSGLTYSAQFGDLLTPWLTAPGGLVTPVSATFERVSVADPEAVGARRFGRVRVTLSE